MSVHCLGIDIGGTSVKVALPTGSTASSDSYSRPDFQTLVQAIRTAVHRLNLGAPIKAVGLAAPGLYDPSRGEITASVNVPGLVGQPLQALIREALGASLPPPVVLTDAHAAALDLLETESSRPVGRLLAISVGTGVGAAVLDDGRPLQISGRSPGHLGQLDVSIHEPGREVPLGPDGGRGGLEAYIGLPALIARYRCTPETLESCLKLDTVPLRALARAIRIAHAIYRPQRVRILGGVGIRLAPFVPFLLTQIATDLTSVARLGWTLSCGTTPFHAARGAARAVLNGPT